MQFVKSITPKKRRGYALLTTLAFLCVALIMFASLMGWVATNAKITKRNNLFNQSQAAAESATEIVIATMSRDFFSQRLNPASSYTGAASLLTQSDWPITFQFSDINGTANASSVNIGAFTTNWSGSLPAQFSGLSGIGQYCDVYSRATPQNVGENLTAMNHQQVWFGLIPIFQFALFYNMDMEINPGPSMTINGRVHSNCNIYAGTGGGFLLFSDIVEAAQQYYNALSPMDPRDAYCGPAYFSITNNNPLSHAQVLSLPIGTTNDQATALSFLGIPPAGTTNAQNYPYNQADIFVKRTGTNLYVYYQNTNCASVQTLVPMDVTNKTSTTNTTYPFKISTTTNTYYSFVTNVIFYDYHEAGPIAGGTVTGTVNAVQLDVGQFGNWLKTNSVAINYQQKNTQGSTSKGHGINSVYISNPSTIPSGSPGGPTKLPGVRLVNGTQLPPAGLTVATAQPIYVLGNYNVTTNNGANQSLAQGDTANTYPAALMGDAVTVLSSNWSDAYPIDINSRIATNTTINAAILEGLVPSNGTNYSGGVQNVIHLLERWNWCSLTYNGSIVVLFQSQYATNFNARDYTGNPNVYNNYYGPPAIRAWAFDQNFLDPSKLPPMTPCVRAFARTLWSSTQ